ncbi:hypothetical protein IEO21_07298 [Rhodonia placenta]|uniref:C2H2-type domain-containing protein n=1 Tax=Rhodonia placenta TaxID=104341 RepID=A0A8H7NYE6_9APHY|nr:hypothetical protein IEO21_07298 [Postia placenta]
MTLSKEPFADTLVIDCPLEAHTHAECSSAVQYDEQVALGLTFEEDEWVFESSWRSLFDSTTLHSSTDEVIDENRRAATSSPIVSEYPWDDEYDVLYIPPDTHAPMLCDYPRHWVFDATLAGPSTFPGALGHPGGTAGGRNTPSSTESSYRIGDSVSYAIVPGLLHAEQGTTTIEHTTTLHDEELQDSGDKDNFEMGASLLHREVFAFNEDKEHSASIEDGPPPANEDVETCASSSSKITSVKQNDKGKERAKPEPPNEHNAQSSKNSKKRKNPHDGHDVDQPIPPKKKHARRKAAKGNWECPEPGCTWTFTREWDMERHWEWDCSARDPSLLKVAICSYCDAQLSRPDALKRHLRDTCPVKKALEASLAERAGEEEAGKAAEAVAEVAQVAPRPDCVFGTHQFHV